MSKAEQKFMLLVGILILALGGYVAIGWLLTNPAMVKIIPDSTAVVFNTAICFMISGLWMALKSTWGFEQRLNTSHWFTTALAIALVALPSLVLIEIACDYDIGIDWDMRHQFVVDRNPTPGRMAPNTSLAFIFIGSAFFFDRIKHLRLKKTALLVLGFCTFFIGASSLFGYFMNLEWLYHFVQLNRMAVPTAAGLSLAGIVLMIIGRSGTYEVPADNKGEDIRLTRIAAMIMVALSLASGLTGFIVLKQGMDQALRDQLQQKAVNGADSISTALERRHMLADKLLSFPVFARDIATLAVTPGDTDSLEHIKKVVSIMLGMGFSCLQIENNNNDTVFSLGTIITQSDLSLPVKIDDQGASLLWNGSVTMHVERPIVKDGVVLGKVVTEQPMTGMDKLLHAIQNSGKSTDSGLCHRDGNFFDCFPSRLVPHIVHAPMFNQGQPAFPMAHALLGETGIIYANDIRGVPVLAAFTPVGDSGLGLVIKIDTYEIFSYVRDRLHILIGLLAFFVISGTHILRSRIQPLATRLVRSEQRMREANDVLEKAQEKLTYLAQYDALTGLPNRSLFMDRLSLALLRAERNNEAMALMFLDLDGFKGVNDTHGHQAGDEVLKQFASRLTTTVREIDTVARLAGDEFTIILEKLAHPEQNVQTIATKIIQAMLVPFNISGLSIPMTTSIGVTISLPGKKNVDDVIHSADTEMYKSKSKGKNQFSLAQI